MVNNDQDLDTLIGGGDCLHHYHNSDRFPARDTLLWLQSIEKVRSTAISTTLTDDDDYLICTATPITVTLPVSRGGKHYTIVNTVVGDVTVARSGTDTITDGSTSVLVSNAKSVLRLKSVTGGWVHI